MMQHILDVHGVTLIKKIGMDGSDGLNNNWGSSYNIAEDGQLISNKAVEIQQNTLKIKLWWISLLEKGVSPLSDKNVKSVKRMTMSLHKETQMSTDCQSLELWTIPRNGSQ
jgi:hypothetical protein